MSSGVEFESTYSRGEGYPGQNPQKGLIGWLMRKGFARTRSQANYILLIVLALAVAGLWITLVSSSDSPLASGKQYDPNEETARARAKWQSQNR